MLEEIEYEIHIYALNKKKKENKYFRKINSFYDNKIIKIFIKKFK